MVNYGSGLPLVLVLGPVAPTPLKFKCNLNIDLSGT